MADLNEVEQATLYLLKKRLERPSSLYPALTRLNEPRLHRIIKDKKSDPQLAQLIKRRNHYTSKVYEYLNEQLGSKSAVASHTGAKSSPLVSQYRGPEVKFITNRYHAELYIRHRILKESAKVNKIKQLIDQQLVQQRQWKKEREQMDDQHQQKVNAISKGVAKATEGFHPSKLQKLKMSNQGSLDALKREHEAEIINLNSRIIATCKHLSAKTIFTFKELEIPFFCTVEHFKYPTLTQDQEHVLNYLQKALM
ncbi:uncharacterized protein CANTADRAFT_48658 [Suhomyces tanzawaensis NRRL Y-17324]|uniref:Uncharacterized protein n=1 Tax=Suhomyces tanzawaensis NRRL Y-17324 TaxID=984487 RepID=A0A1E4SLD9_9ASCO|nr:uncharacterized protein CANTADRAFT_48658 [Suhomyces tanzawaensis NRRL Y-17324]ODV80323.1 hypothetical protein CANTADRAFT_48658 [Suhomyces tanzawaensis NRRL Y-17324]